MKNLKHTFYAMAYGLCLLILAGGCKEEALNNEAEIIFSFKVKNEAGKEYNAVIGNDNTITIKISPYLDPATELAVATPSFYISRGATVTPDPSTPQDFTQAGGVKYTVTAEDGVTRREYTVTWGISDKMPAGAGFSYAEIGAAKTFPELGYPGTVGDYNIPSIEYGDLYLFHAYCGNYIVLLSRSYIDVSPTSPHAIKVVDKTTLEPAAGVSLNLGSIAPANLKMITSDYKGRCVGAVTNGAGTEFFYWTTPTAAPVSIGSTTANMALYMAADDCASNFQVAGDITGNAWITAVASHNANGGHYRIKVTDGRLATVFSVVRTSYSSDDCNKFQMISPLDDSDEPRFIIGDVEGALGANGSVRCYINSFAGSTLSIMPPLWNSILQQWWTQTGQSLQRTGSRRPMVSGMVINGKSYALVTTGTAWWHAAAVLEADLSALTHLNLNMAASISTGWSFGEWADWYWDEEAGEGHLAVWFGRIGLYTYKLTCFE
ncbi:MAG: DUF5018 domain-containing protein [Prevotellaceae bacterium]|jgi:hypothetical protein|nr:DUF5018 domain-containing protein [Prevotellaceae bacterium]